MFVYTWKIDRKKLILAIFVILVLAALAVLLFSGRSEEAASLRTGSGKTNDDRVSFLVSLGWEVETEPIEDQEVVIPSDFSDVYAKYAELQSRQGFDIRRYCGVKAHRYTYLVKNYPGEASPVVADIIVYKNRIIAGDIQCPALDGFMQGLEYPG